MMAAPREYVYDPAFSPYFGAQEQGDGMNTRGSGSGLGWLDYSQFPELADALGLQTGNEISGASTANALRDRLQQLGWSMYDQPLSGDNYGAGQSLRGFVDPSGNFVGGGPQTVDTPSDRGFWNAGLAAAALAGGAAAGYGGAGSAGAADAAGAAAGSGLGAGAGGAAGSAGAGAGAGLGSAAGAGGSGMGWFDWANLAANVAGSAIQDRAAARATDAQVSAANRATDLQGRIFDTTNQQQAPYRAAGYAALDDMMGLRGGPSMTPQDVMNEPGYQFGREQGMRGIENSAAARGMGLSGSAIKNASRFNTDYASTRYGDAWNRRQADFGNRWGRLAALAGIGQSANQLTAGAGQAFGQQAGQNMMGAGNAIGAGAITRGNIWANAANQGASAYGRMGWGQPSYGQTYQQRGGAMDTNVYDPYGFPNGGP